MIRLALLTGAFAALFVTADRLAGTGWAFPFGAAVVLLFVLVFRDELWGTRP